MGSTTVQYYTVSVVTEQQTSGRMIQGHNERNTTDYHAMPCHPIERQDRYSELGHSNHNGSAHRVVDVDADMLAHHSLPIRLDYDYCTRSTPQRSSDRSYCTVQCVSSTVSIKNERQGTTTGVNNNSSSNSNSIYSSSIIEGVIYHTIHTHA